MSKIQKQGIPDNDFPLLNKRIELVRHSIIKVFAQSKRGQVGFNRLMERVFLLLQEPICLAFFVSRRSEQGLNLFHIGHTVYDPLYKKTASVIIEKKYLCDERFLKNTNLAIQIFGSRYWLVAFNIKTDDNRSLSLAGIDTNNHPHAYYQLTQVLADFSNQSGFEHLQSTVDETFDLVRMRNYFINPAASNPKNPILLQNLCLSVPREANPLPKSAIVQNHSPKKSSDSFYTVENIAMKIGLKQVSNICNELYEDCYKSPAVSRLDRNPPNVLFFFKFFNRLSERFEKTYHFNTQLIIPENQKQHWVSLFEMIREANTDIISNIGSPVSTWKLPHLTLGQQSFTEVIHKPRIADRNIDLEFWNLLSSEAGPHNIVDQLARPTSKFERFFSDGALCSGTLHVDHSVAGQLISQADSTTDKASKDNLRLRNASSHYLGEAMRPYGAGDASFILAPCRVSDANWAAMGNISEYKKSEFGFPTEEKFNKIYHFHDSVVGKLAQRLRERSETEYLNAISECVHTIHRLYHDKGTDAFESLNDKTWDTGMAFIEHLNLGFSALGRIFPFPVVQVDVTGEVRKKLLSAKLKDTGHKGTIKNEYFATVNGPYIHVLMIQNPWYDAYKYDEYIGIKRVRSLMLRLFTEISQPANR